MKTTQIVLASRPKGVPTVDNFRFEQLELPDTQAGEVRLKPMYYSVDPYMRGRMNDVKSYAPPYKIDKPIYGMVVANVTESKSDKFKSGDTVVGQLPWQQQITADSGLLKLIDKNVGSPSYYLDVLGMTGLTAYFGLIHICKPKAGETVVVSGAAGAVGLVVGQIAKIHGCRVVGIAGSDEKIKLLVKKYGFDKAINYKIHTDMENRVADACPSGVDIYFDNVGGEISDAVLGNLNVHARIALCGQISLYNCTEIPMGPRLQPILLTKSALMQGFLVSDYKTSFPEGMTQLAKWLKDDKLKGSETIFHGFDQLPAAFIGLFSGENTGKMMVEA